MRGKRFGKLTKKVKGRNGKKFGILIDFRTLLYTLQKDILLLLQERAVARDIVYPRERELVEEILTSFSSTKGDMKEFFSSASFPFFCTSKVKKVFFSFLVLGLLGSLFSPLLPSDEAGLKDPEL